jgi:nicotinamidase-related amidase
MARSTPKEVLVVIDMQPNFTASTRVLKPVKRLMLQARKKQQKILIVEYASRYSGYTYPKTHHELMRVVSRYPHYKVVKKYHNAGHDVVIRNLSTHKHILHVCGVNFSACVQATVEGLLESKARRIAKVNVISKACSDGKGGCAKKTIIKQYYPPHPKLSIDWSK